MIKLLYLILLAAAALFWPLYKGDVAFLLLAVLIILPFLLAAQLAVTVRMFSAEMKMTMLPCSETARERWA